MKTLRRYIVLTVVCIVLPAVAVWLVLPNLLPSFKEGFPKLYDAVSRLMAIYVIIAVTRLIIAVARKLQTTGDRSAANQQYLNSFIGVLKIVLIFIDVILIVAIVFDKDPSTLLAGLGAISAVLMLAFQDTIKGLVAGIRLTSNNMVAVGDRITVHSAGADGIVEEITLTTVKVRNFDNTIITVTPQTLVDGSFQNWRGMVEREGRKAVRRFYVDFRSLTLDEEGVPNLTRYREHIEQWLAQNDLVLADKIIMVHQLDATPTGLPVEFVFWLKAQDVVTYEHAISTIMEYAYAEAPVFGLRIYQQFPEQ